jgi:hypothetical protein
VKGFWLFLCLSVVSFVAKGQDSIYLWPTNSGKFLSSTFGETRSAHFHAGLDIKTWGREGYKVFASKDGYLSKLIITNQGYGKAIYLKHFDGTYTVYAHLQRFNSEYQAIADSIRINELDYSYTFEQSFEDKKLMVKQGDVIGYTGSTGIGPPHLHFEIRNSLNQPINPLSSNLAVQDTISPVFSSLLIEPLNINSKVFSSYYPSEIKPISVKNDTTYFDTVFVSGDIGLSANVYDQANQVNNKYAVYDLKLNSNIGNLYHEQINLFDFSDADKMFVNRVPSPDNNRRRFQRLFDQEKYQHPFLIYESKSQNSEFTLYEIIAEDYYGNQAVAIVPVKHDSLNTSKKTPKTSDTYWTNDWIVLNDSMVADLQKNEKDILWDRFSPQRIISLSDPNHIISRLSPNSSYKIISPDYKTTLYIESDTFFDSLSLVQNFEFHNDSIFLKIGETELVNRKNLFIQIQLPESYQKRSQLNLYQIDEEDDEYSFVDSWVSGIALNAEIPSFGNFVVLKDSIPPQIRRPKLERLGNGAQTYTISTTDNLSGIDFRTASFWINEQKGIPEYDYENDSFTFYLPNFKLKDENTIRFEVSDKAGNFTSESFLLRFKQ